jgi:hypothetical protein
LAAVTRRQALIGAALTGGAVFGLWGRYAIGGTFEEHVADVLGLEREVTDALLETLRADQGLDYNARAAAFLFATTSPARHVMPEGAKRDAIDSFVTPLFDIGNDELGLDYGLPMTYAYAGLQRNGDYQACAALVSST